jgi:riboflavin kinase/FMN adenylyltransferase
MADLRVLYSLEELLALGLKGTAVSVGVFDGIHRGHSEIIKELIQYKRMGRAQSVVLMTFNPHPLIVTHSRMAPPILSTLEERLELLRAFPLDVIFVIEFDTDIANMAYRAFIDKYLLKGAGMKHLVIGYDFHFGKNREGSPEKITEECKKRNLDLKIVEPVKLDGIIISSTQIRNQLIEGDMEKAVRLLGHPYLMHGKVVHGHGKGDSIGFPTANISVSNPYKLWPAQGVYAVKAKIRDRIYLGMMNVGTSPTMKDLREGTREMEIHVFDFADDIYGEDVFVYCQQFMREEHPFPSVEALVAQLEKDKETALRILTTQKRSALG